MRLTSIIAPRPFVLAASDHVETISRVWAAIDLSGELASAFAHQTRSFWASLEICRLQCLLPGGKYSCILYSRRRNVWLRGTTVETKFRYPVIFWSSRREADRFIVNASIMDSALSCFLAGSRITISLVSSSMPAKACYSSLLVLCLLDTKAYLLAESCKYRRMPLQLRAGG